MIAGQSEQSRIAFLLSRFSLLNLLNKRPESINKLSLESFLGLFFGGKVASGLFGSICSCQRLSCNRFATVKVRSDLAGVKVIGVGSTKGCLLHASGIWPMSKLIKR